MRNIKLTIEYDGTAYAGWQIQSSQERTIQGEIEHALTKIFQEPIRVFGSGRTDAGVHAKSQVAHFKTSSIIAAQKIPPALNAHLPKDISILAAEEVPLRFHSQFSAREKTYTYTILNRSSRPALLNNRCHHIAYKLSITPMKNAAQYLMGRHDFRSFTATDSKQNYDKKASGTVRTIKKLTIQKKGELIVITITANGFLYKMVRNIVGTLIEVGGGKLAPEAVKDILKQKSRTAAKETAPAQGLTLEHVVYKS